LPPPLASDKLGPERPNGPNGIRAMPDLPGLDFSMTIRPRASGPAVRVLAAGAVMPGVQALVALARRTIGVAFDVTYSNGTRLVRRLQAGEVYDLLIAAPAGIEVATNSEGLLADSIAPVGRVYVGAVTRASSEAPDVSTVDALRSSLLAADTIVYNAATSGGVVEAMLAKLGVAEALRSRTVRPPNGPSVVEHLLRGTGRDLGFGAATEMRALEPRGVRLADALPRELDPCTHYRAAIMRGVANEGGARAALDMIASPAGRAAFAQAGIE